MESMETIAITSEAKIKVSTLLAQLESFAPEYVKIANEEFGRIISNLRGVCDISRTEFESRAIKFGTSASQLRSLEAGSGRVTTKLVESVAHVLEISPMDLWTAYSVLIQTQIDSHQNLH